MEEYTIDQLCKVFDDMKRSKMDQNIKECGIEPLPGSVGTGGPHKYLKTDLYHLALFFTLQLNGMKREIIAAMLKQHPLHGKTPKELQRISFIVYRRKGKFGLVETTESLELDMGVPEQIVHDDAFTVCFLINFAKLKRVIDGRIRSLGL
jgi:hypothetical protein